MKGKIMFKDSLYKKAKFSTSETSRILDVHQRTLRIWDDKDILKPKRSDKNRRKYSFNNIEKGKLIIFLTRNLGMNLAGIKMLFSLMKMDEDFFKDKTKCILKAVKDAKIDKEIQKENLRKSLRKGRKKASIS